MTNSLKKIIKCLYDKIHELKKDNLDVKNRLYDGERTIKYLE